VFFFFFWHTSKEVSRSSQTSHTWSVPRPYGLFLVTNGSNLSHTQTSLFLVFLNQPTPPKINPTDHFSPPINNKHANCHRVFFLHTYTSYNIHNKHSLIHSLTHSKHKQLTAALFFFLFFLLSFVFALFLRRFSRFLDCFVHLAIIFSVSTERALALVLAVSEVLKHIFGGQD